MLGLAARLIGGMFTPLIDQISASSARLLRKLALFLVAALCSIVVLIALTIAFDLWVASKAGAIVGALAVAGLYLTVAILAVVIALRPGESKSSAPKETQAPPSAANQERDAEIDDFAAPLLKMLQSLGLRKEQLAVLAGTSVAKQIGPIPLVGLAIVAGFLLGRTWSGLRDLLSSDLIKSLLASDLLAGLFRGMPETATDEDEEDQARDAA